MKNKLFILVVLALSFLILGLFMNNKETEKKYNELEKLTKSMAKENIILYNKIDYLESHDCVVIMNEN